MAANAKRLKVAQVVATSIGNLLNVVNFPKRMRFLSEEKYLGV
jgi:hypothetical protein